jgi:hypothetical protein
MDRTAERQMTSLGLEADDGWRISHIISDCIMRLGQIVSQGNWPPRRRAPNIKSIAVSEYIPHLSRLIYEHCLVVCSII